MTDPLIAKTVAARPRTFLWTDLAIGYGGGVTRPYFGVSIRLSSANAALTRFAVGVGTLPEISCDGSGSYKLQSTATLDFDTANYSFSWSKIDVEQFDLRVAIDQYVQPKELGIERTDNRKTKLITPDDEIIVGMSFSSPATTSTSDSAASGDGTGTSDRVQFWVDDYPVMEVATSTRHSLSVTSSGLNLNDCLVVCDAAGSDLTFRILPEWMPPPPPPPALQ